MDHKKHIAKIIEYISKIVLIAYALFFGIFAVFSGSDALSGGISAVIQNSPNAVPWIILFVVVLLLWKYEAATGVIVIIMGLIAASFYDFINNPSLLFIISFPLVFFGALLIMARVLKIEKATHKNENT